MRIIPKLLTGFIPIHYQPTRATAQAAGAGVLASAPAAPADSSKDDDELLSDKMKQYIIEEALPSDAALFINNASIFGKDILSGNIGPTNSTNLMKEMLIYLNKMNHEKTLYHTNLKLIDQIGGMGEAAVSVNGGIFVVRGKKILNIKVSDLRNGETPLTNALIANIRANSSAYAFNTDLTSALGNATSMTAIKKVIDANLAGLEEYSNENEYLVPGTSLPGLLPVLKAISAMNITLEDLASMDYNTLLSVKAKLSGNEKLVHKAVTSIYSLLDRNMKTLLQLRARELSELTGNEISPYALILEYASSRMKGEVSYTLDVKGRPGSDSSKSSDSDSLNKLELPASALALAGYGHKEWVTLNPGTNGEINSLAVISNITKSTGEIMGQTSLANILSSALGSLFNTGSATLAGVRIDESKFGYVMLSSSLYKLLDLPIDIAEYNKSGIIKPDIELTKKVSEIEKLIQEQNITNPEEINALYQKAGLAVKYSGRDKNGNPILNINNYRKFAALDVMADGQSLPSNVDFDDYDEDGSNLVKLVDDSSAVDNMTAVLKQYNKDFSPSDHWYGNDIWSGVMYIPINEHMINAFVGSNKSLKSNSALLLDMEEHYRQRLGGINSAYTKSPSAASIGLNY